MLDSIQSLAENCSFASETNGNVDALICGRNVSTLSVSTFQSAMPQLANQTISAESFDDVVSNQQDVGAGWDDLRSCLESNLSSLTVFKTGTIQREVFIVGLSGGRIIGVRSFAVET